MGVLAPSRTSFESITLTAPSSAGAYYYGACVDAVSGESDIDNNCSAAVTVAVVAPDLVVDAPTVSTSSPTYGTHFILSVTVRNQGTGRAGITTLRYYLSTDATITASDTEVGSQTVWGLAGFGNQRPFNQPARPLERRRLLLRRLRGERQRGKRYRE